MPTYDAKLKLRAVKQNDPFVSFYNNFNKPELVAVFSRAIETLRKKNIDYGNSDKTMVAKMKAALTNGSASLLKAELVSLLASFSADVQNYLAMLKYLPKDAKVWEELVRKPFITLKEADRISGRKIKAYSTNSWNSKTMLEMPYQFFDIYDPYYRYFRSTDNFTLVIAPGIRKIIAPDFLSKKEYEMITTPADTEFPDTLALQSFEDGIADDVRYLVGLEACGQLVKWDTESLPQARIKSIAGKMKSADFEYDINKLSRKGMLTLAFGLYAIHVHRRNGNLDSLTDFAKFVKDKFGNRLISSLFHPFFPDYKGFTITNSEINYAEKIIDIAFKLIKTEPGKWVSMSNLPQRYLFENGGLSYPKGYVPLFSDQNKTSGGIYRADEKSKSYYATHSPLDEWEELTRPFVMRVYKLLCACGLVDLVVEKKVSKTDPAEGIRYARLTELGRYAMGLTTAYEVKSSAPKGPAFEYDDRNSIITLLDTASPYGVYLDQIGRRIGGNRFHISAASLISNSDDKADALRRIEIFRTYICPNPEGHWLNLITEALERLNIILSDNKTYALYQLNPNVPGLIEFIANNREIGLNSLKAENNTLLVERSFADRFEKLLHKAGYIV